jgi:hypothetical protein
LGQNRVPLPPAMITAWSMSLIVPSVSFSLSDIPYRDRAATKM